MRSPWSEHGDEATQRTPEGEARARRLAEVAVRALASGHDISRDTTGTRCSNCKVKRTADGRCLCGGSKSHG
jgi:hypothetical protein